MTEKRTDRETGRRKRKDRFRYVVKQPQLRAILGILLLYALCCLAYWFFEYGGPAGAKFSDILLWNTATLFGADFAERYPITVSGRMIGIVILLIGMFGVTVITGYVSSTMIDHRMKTRRGTRKLQSMKNHIIICGWKNNLKALLEDIVRKNHGVGFQDLVLVNSRDEDDMSALLEDEDLRGIKYVRGDFSEEQVLQKANAARASNALILGDDHDRLSPELVDSRVFAAMLALKGMNPKIHICAQVQTKKYKHYLETNHCDEVIYTEEYTRYILSTATSGSGMARVLSALFDNGDGISVQVFPIENRWVGKTYREIADYYKEHGHIMAMGVLDNMGGERELKHAVLADAQKSTDYSKIVSRLQEIKTLERNKPVLNPPDDLVITARMGLIVLGDEV
ncbi:MAG: NAD-binding protein [Lachnospiraceae bacterium]|nr:NAD-binding protein [Lachnospiraceae bacterium]